MSYNEKLGVNYVSFSELSVYNDCPFKWHLTYQKGHRSGDTIHTVFGNAIHDAIDKKFTSNEIKYPWISMGKKIYRFVRDNPTDRWIFEKDENGKKIQVNQDPKEWVRSAFSIFNQIFGWLEKEFPQYELVASEIRMMDPLFENPDYYFKGFIDLVIKHEKKFHLIDFKTCNKDWSPQKRKDPIRKYQIQLYKENFCRANHIHPDEVLTYFLLLKRNPAKTKGHFELIKSPSEKKNLKEATGWAKKQLRLLDKGFKMKKRGKCHFCDFHKTELCP